VLEGALVPGALPALLLPPAWLGQARPNEHLDVDLSELERRLLSELALGEATIDSLSTATQVPAGRISAALLQLEMKRLVRQLPGKYFSKAG
jgi:DNA processing protein